MTRRPCDGPSLLQSIRAALANLERHVDEVNALNVFPVPDGDTGSNMVATVRAAVEEGSGVADPTADRMAAALAFGALMGARGNSGVITSQIFRGFAEGLAGRRHVSALDLADALRLGAERAYGAVAEPVEGTMLTVARAAARAAVRTAEDTNDMDAVMAAAVAGAERAVALTPSQLPILREAGVVDAGGQGLLRLLQGASHALVEHPAEPAVPPTLGAPAPAGTRAPAHVPAPTPTIVAQVEEGFGYETMFLVQPREGESLDTDAIRLRLAELGTSVIVAGDARAAKVHVHSESPDAIMAYGLTLGTLTRISVENLDDQTRETLERRAADFTDGDTAIAGAGQPGVRPATELLGHASTVAPAPDPASAASVTSGRNGTGPTLGVIAVAAGDGLARVLESFGSTTVVHGGQAANPSTGELLAAVAAAAADELVLLPNNPNVVLAARQVAAMADRRVHVVPTRNAAEGVAALLALDPVGGAAANAEAMARAARDLQTLQVTEAVRNAKIGGRRVRRGDTIVLDPDDGLVASGRDRDATVLEAIDALQPGFELVTIYYGADVDLGETEALVRRIAARHPGLDTEVVRGGQPHYHFLISAE